MSPNLGQIDSGRFSILSTYTGNFRVKLGHQRHHSSRELAEAALEQQRATASWALWADSKESLLLAFHKYTGKFRGILRSNAMSRCV